MKKDELKSRLTSCAAELAGAIHRNEDLMQAFRWLLEHAQLSNEIKPPQHLQHIFTEAAQP